MVAKLTIWKVRTTDVIPEAATVSYYESAPYNFHDKI